MQTISSKDTIQYSKLGFDNEKYLKTQKNLILERLDQFIPAKLYLEIGGKFTYDPHASRVLPGFDPKVKTDILSSLKHISEYLFCINAIDIKSDRKLGSDNTSYKNYVLEMLKDVYASIGVRPIVVINLMERDKHTEVDEFSTELVNQGYKVYKRYKINGYPEAPDFILSEDGYGYDEYIETSKNLIVVLGAASNSGKMSTCLGQIYQDQQKGIKSGYAKYETFPIWSLPLEHPINLAYEAATADIGDYNVIDKFHLAEYGQKAINYNRDVDAYPILDSIIKEIVKNSDSPMKAYNSPTDMGMNNTGKCITNDEVCCIASLQEINRRKVWYQNLQEPNSEKWAKKCSHLANQAEKYIEDRNYNKNLEIA